MDTGLLIKNRYELHNVLGKGANAVVYRATDTLTGQQVAVKKMFETISKQTNNSKKGHPANTAAATADPQAASWLAEVHLLQSLEHPNIVRYLDDSSDEGPSVCIVMEYAAGGSLLNAVRRGPLSEFNAGYYVAQVLQGLIYLHGRRVLHRDVKAANVLLFQQTQNLAASTNNAAAGGLQRRGSEMQLNKTTTGNSSPLARPPQNAQRRLSSSGGSAAEMEGANMSIASRFESNDGTTERSPSIHHNNNNNTPPPFQAKLTDFGLAVPRPSTGDNQQQFTMLVGSVYWMAPESIVAGQYSEESDVWSLGCLAIELLTGAPPFFDRAPVNALYHIANTNEEVALPMTLSPECRSFVSTCLRRNASERPKASVLRAHPWLAPYLPAAPDLHTLPTLLSGGGPVSVQGGPSASQPQNHNGGDYFLSSSFSMVPGMMDLNGSQLAQGQASWVENGLFGDDKVRWLQDGGLALAIRTLTSITAEESFRVVRSLAFAAQRCRQTFADHEQQLRFRAQQQQQSKGSQQQSVVTPMKKDQDATTTGSDPNSKKGNSDFDALFESPSSPTNNNKNNAQQQRAASLPAMESGTMANAAPPRALSDSPSLHHSQTITNDDEELEFALCFFRAFGELEFWELDLPVLAATESLATLYADCCACQQPSVPHYAPTHPRALKLLLGSPHAAATRCASALHKLLVADEERHILDHSHAEAARNRARKDGVIDVLRDILEDHCRAAFREGLNGPTNGGDAAQQQQVGTAPGGTPMTSTLQAPNSSAALGTSFFNNNRRSSTTLATDGMNNLNNNTSSAGGVLDPVRWGAIDHLFGILYRLCESPLRLRTVATTSEESWIMNLQEAAKHDCWNAVLLLLDTLRVATGPFVSDAATTTTQPPAHVLAGLEDRSIRVGVSVLISLAADQRVPTELRMRIARSLPQLQKQSAVTRAVLQDPHANIPLLALMLRLLSPNAPIIHNNAKPLGRTTTVTSTSSLTAVSPLMSLDGVDAFATSPSTSVDSPDNALHTLKKDATMLDVLLVLCLDESMASSCASYDGFLPQLVAKITEARSRASNSGVLAALRLTELLFAASPRPEVFVTNRALTKTLVDMVKSGQQQKLQQQQQAGTTVGGNGIEPAAAAAAPMNGAPTTTAVPTGTADTSTSTGVTSSSQQQQVGPTTAVPMPTIRPARKAPDVFLVGLGSGARLPTMSTLSGLRQQHQPQQTVFQPNEQVQKVASRFLNSLAAQGNMI